MQRNIKLLSDISEAKNWACVIIELNNLLSGYSLQGLVYGSVENREIDFLLILKIPQDILGEVTSLFYLKMGDSEWFWVKE